MIFLNNFVEFYGNQATSSPVRLGLVYNGLLYENSF